MRKNVQFMFGIATGILLCAGVTLLVLASGCVNLAASVKPGWLERTLAPWAVDRSRELRAPSVTDPYTNAAALAAGLQYYREDCMICHGAPNVRAGELARGLNPPAPRLQSPDTEGMSDGELFWTVRHGVRMSGMPAFEQTHTDEQIWQLVAFIRHLPGLTAGETAALRGSTKAEDRPATGLQQSSP